MAITLTTADRTMELDHEYDTFERLVRERIANFRGPVFTTTADPDLLWRLYLENLPANQKHYDCHCCRRFIQRYGGLATINSHGIHSPLLWEMGEELPNFFRTSVASLAVAVRMARVDGVFVWDSKSEGTWGTPQTHPWTHLSGTPGETPRVKPTLNACQLMAELKEDYRVLQRGLAEYPWEVAKEARRLLTMGGLYRSEKAEQVAEWFVDLHEAVRTKKPGSTFRENTVWMAVATAPPGFAHVKNGMTDTLMDDILARLSLEDIKRRWAEKMSPLQYQRPTAAPTAGNVARANKLFDELGLAPALKRRFATLEDVTAFEWRPPVRAAEPEKPSRGTFEVVLKGRYVQEKGEGVALPIQTMTWAKFKRTVLPGATWMEVRLEITNNFYGLLTAVEPTAPPLLQWDGAGGRRNPVSWYVYPFGSHCHQWGLSPGWVTVTGVFRSPAHWAESDKFNHFPERVHFALCGAKDQNKPGLGLFPEILKGELREVRSTIEAYSRGGKPEGADEATANGLMYEGKGVVQLKVRTPNGVARYTIDRME